MSKPIRNHWSASLQLCGVAGLVFAACHAEAQYDPNWTKNFRIGALTGLGVKGQIKLRGSFTVNGRDPTPGVYDDGYVRTDDTDNAGDLTSFWGYDNAAQYDAGAQTMTLSSSSAFTANGSSSMSQEFTAGIEVAYGNNLRKWERSRLGWEFGFGYLPLALKSDSSIAGTVTRTKYVFNNGGILILGNSWQGGSSGTGPLIDPRIVSTSTEDIDGVIRDVGNLDATLFTFRLGPTLFLDVTPEFGLAGSIGPAFGVLTETCRFDEKITYGDGSTGRAKGNFSATDLVYGAYVNMVATYHADENGDIYIGVQYMPMTGSKFSQGGREASVDLMGQIYFMLGVNWIF